jgi:hypothetical protein
MLEQQLTSPSLVPGGWCGLFSLRLAPLQLPPSIGSHIHGPGSLGSETCPVFNTPLITVLNRIIIFYVFLAKIRGKHGVLYKTNYNLWFYAKDSPITGVICYFLSLLWTVLAQLLDVTDSHSLMQKIYG